VNPRTRPIATHRAHAMERALLPFVNVVVLPAFALGNVGIRLSGTGWSGRAWVVFLAVLAARLVGKPLGIVAAMLASDRVTVEDMELGGMLGIGWAAAVGFTVPLLIVAAALPPGPVADAAKAALVVSSVVAVAMTYALRHRPRARTSEGGR
jgi:Na+:H+ antiporter, NhaA family